MIIETLTLPWVIKEKECQFSSSSQGLEILESRIGTYIFEMELLFNYAAYIFMSYFDGYFDG